MDTAQAGSANTMGRRPRSSGFRVTLTGGTAAERAELRKALAALTDLNVEVAELSIPPRAVSSDGGAMVDVLMFVLEEDPELWGEELRSWIGQGGWALVVAVLAKRSAEFVRQALRAGANEVLFLPLDPVDVARLLLKVSEEHCRAGGTTGEAVYSLVSVAGGAGVSTLAVMLGLALVRLTNKTIALVDLGLQASALSTLLDLEPQRTISELADPTSAIDSIRLEPIICKHASGLHLLSAPKAIEEGEMVSAATIEATMTLMTQLFDFVVVDCGHHITEGLVAAWERSDRVLYLLDQSVVSIHCARRFLDLFARLHLKHVSLDLVLNRFRPGHPITVQKIEASLGRRIALCIPRDEATLIAAETAQGGMADLPARSPAVAAVDHLARMLLGGAYAPGEAQRRGVFSRLFSAVSH
jgi:Flp pilus assembly CpaE family ATPase